MAGVRVRSGTYHNAVFDYDSSSLMDAIVEICNQNKYTNLTSKKYQFTIVDVKRGEGYVIGRILMVRPSGQREVIDKTTNKITIEEIKDAVESYVCFYLNKDGDIILEEKSDFSRFRFASVLSALIHEYAMQYDSMPPIMGKRFEITFDRYGSRVSDFINDLETLNEIKIKVLVHSNPFRISNAKELAEALDDVQANCATFTGPDMNKDSPLVESAKAMNTDGHANLVFKGTNRNGEKVSRNFDNNDDDQYSIRTCRKDVNVFYQRISEIIKIVRKNHQK